MMNRKLAKLLGYTTDGELNSDEFFPYVDHVGPRADIMLCSDDSLLAVLQMPGAMFSVSLNSERNANKRRLVAFLNATADQNVEIHIHGVKHDATLPPAAHGAAAEPYARMLLADYHATIEPDMAVLDWFLSVRVKPREVPFAGVTDKARSVLAAVGLLPKVRTVDALLEVQLEDAMRLAHGTLAPFSPVRLGVRHETDDDGKQLAFSEIAEFLYLLRTTRHEPQPMADVLGFLGAGVAALDVTSLPKVRLLRIDHATGASASAVSYAGVLGLTTYPRSLSQERMDDLLALPGRFVLTVAICFQSRAKAQDSLDLLQRRLTSGNTRATEDLADLEQAINDVAGGRSESGLSRWSLVLHAGTPAEIDQLVSAARNVVANAGAKVGPPEKTAALNAYLAQLPGAPMQTWVRVVRCSTRQVAALAPLSGYARGAPTARWGAHLFRMMTPGGTAFDHDLFVGDVGHSFLDGPNGGGKTVFLGTCIAAVDGAVRQSGGTQIVLDVDESNHNTIAMLHGRYSTVQVGRSGVAPLHMADSPRLRAMIRDLVAGLVQTDGAPPPSKVERDGIRAGVDFVMGEMEPHVRELSVVRSYMGYGEHGAGERLEPWCRGGELGWVFDGEEHVIDFNHRLVGTDITAIMNDARIMLPFATLLLWMASDVMDGRRVVIWCEEAPAYMPTPAFAKPFKGIALRARKRNASFNAIAQQPGDMLSNDAGLALIKQARQFVSFRNDKAVPADYAAKGYTPKEILAVSERMFTVPHHTVLIKRQDGQSGVMRFDLSPLPQHLNVLSGTPRRVVLLRQCIANHGEDRMAAFAEFQSRIHETAA